MTIYISYVTNNLLCFTELLIYKPIYAAKIFIFYSLFSKTAKWHRCTIAWLYPFIAFKIAAAKYNNRLFKTLFTPFQFFYLQACIDFIS
jgi:hypothetical protein